MKSLFLTISFILLKIALAFSQKTDDQWLVTKFKNADTILLVSHELVYGSTDEVIDKNGKIFILPKLTINGRPNRKIITEERIIKRIEIDTILKILKRPNKDSFTMQGGCFVPHQAILLIKNNKTSYIDLCFHCGSYETSGDLQNIPAFDKRRWKELEKYFRSHGIKYLLDKPLH